MNPDFQRSMAEATRLTRSGDLRGAAAAIQAALGERPVTAAMHADDTDVIDVQAREIPSTTADIPPAPDTAAPTDRFISGSHSDAGLTRAYKLYAPPAYCGQPLPLVVMLHGCTQNPDDFAAGTGMNDAARERGFFVLYPAQAQGANPSRCWNWFKPNHQRRGRGEPALLAGMTREVMKRFNIDPQRVYVAGLSAGGAMATILGEAYPDLFAAVGVHSGLPVGSAKDATSAFAAMKSGCASASRAAPARPTIVFHGDQDATVHPLNGEQVLAVKDASAQIERARSANGRTYTRSVYRDAGDRVVAEHWLVHGAGHAWSGGRAAGSYTDATGPSASDEMLRFFFAQTLSH